MTRRRACAMTLAVLEVGVRHQFSARVVLDGGVGSDVFGPDNRAAWFGTVGMSVGF